jgi:hypothetical protein
MIDGGLIGEQLFAWWEGYNDDYLDGTLRPPVLRIAEQAALGTWQPETRTLAISARHLADDPWLAVMETLRHEMAHQYADEVLFAAGEPPHGPKFKEACRRLRVCPRANGDSAAFTPDARETTARSTLLDRVHKLLSLSTSPNEHEAESALRKAREILLRHNIGEAEVGASRDFGMRWLGPARPRHQLWEYQLASILSDFFFVRSIWVPTFDPATLQRCSVLEVHGTTGNLAMADYVHGYLTRVLDDLARQYERRVGRLGALERARFFAGVLGGFSQKLAAEGRRLAAEHALVWKGDPRLEDEFRHHHPHIRTKRGSGLRRTRAYDDGREEGGKLTLRKPIDAEKRGFGGYLGGR